MNFLLLSDTLLFPKTITLLFFLSPKINYQIISILRYFLCFYDNFALIISLINNAGYFLSISLTLNLILLPNHNHNNPLQLNFSNSFYLVNCLSVKPTLANLLNFLLLIIFLIKFSNFFLSKIFTLTKINDILLFL